MRMRARLRCLGAGWRLASPASPGRGRFVGPVGVRDRRSAAFDAVVHAAVGAACRPPATLAAVTDAAAPRAADPDGPCSEPGPRAGRGTFPTRHARPTWSRPRTAAGFPDQRLAALRRLDPRHGRRPVRRPRPPGHRGSRARARRREYAALGIVDAEGVIERVHHERDVATRAGADRRAPARPRDPGADHPREPVVPGRGPDAGPPALRLPAQPPGDARLPRRAREHPRPVDRQPLPHREGRRVQRGGRAAGGALRRPRRASRSRTPGSTTRCSGSPSSRSASGSAATSTTA